MSTSESENRDTECPDMRDWMPLDMVRGTFDWLATRPYPLCIDGRRFPGLPDEEIPADQLREVLLHGDCPLTTHDAVWADLVRRARAERASAAAQGKANRGTWTMVCAGLALPALAGTIRLLAPSYPDDPADLHSAVIMGFIAELTSVNLDEPGVFGRLWWGARRSGHTELAAALVAPTPIEPGGLDEPDDGPIPLTPGFRSASPRQPWGHPDLVLARAVADGVLTPTEADLIGTTRLEHVGVAGWARAHGVALMAVYSVRWRAERRLLAYLTEDARLTDPEDLILPAVLISLALSTRLGTVTSIADPSRSVSGRRRKRRRVHDGTPSPALPKVGPESGLLKRGGSTPTDTDPTGPTPPSEEPRCA